MYLVLYRHGRNGDAVHGHLYLRRRSVNSQGIAQTQETLICETLENQNYLILPLIYHVKVTLSPKFKRLLPLICGVPGRSGIRMHRGTKPEHSKGCILVPTREMEDYLTDMLLRAQQDGEEVVVEVNVA